MRYKEQLLKYLNKAQTKFRISDNRRAICYLPGQFSIRNVQRGLELAFNIKINENHETLTTRFLIITDFKHSGFLTSKDKELIPLGIELLISDIENNRVQYLE